MNKMINKIGACVLGVMIGFLSLGSSGVTGQNLPDREELENYLKRARVISNQPSLKGRTKAWEVQLDDGKVQMKGFFKHINFPRPRFPADCYKYELAAYELDKLLDLYIIPPVVEKEIRTSDDTITGSLQVFVENCVSLRTVRRQGTIPPEPGLFKDAMDEIAVFELLTNDECRDESDIMVHTETWRLCRVDFSMAFAPAETLMEKCQFVRCSRRLYTHLKELDIKTAAGKLSLYLNTDEIEALWQRRTLILERIDALIKEKGEKEVLFG